MNRHYPGPSTFVPERKILTISFIDGKKGSLIIHENVQDRELRRSILQHYKCPFQDENKCKHESRPYRCNFGHAGTSDGLNLKEIPHYVCVYNLLRACSYASTKRCKSGFHLTAANLLDSQTFEKENAKIIKNFYGKDGDRECSVCLEKVVHKYFLKNRQFALLENCDHVFCARCILECRKSSIRCPMCRIESQRYALSYQYHPNSPSKREIFNRFLKVFYDPIPRDVILDSFFEFFQDDDF